jgi:hypothetical protein
MPTEEMSRVGANLGKVFIHEHVMAETWLRGMQRRPIIEHRLFNFLPSSCSFKETTKMRFSTSSLWRNSSISESSNDAESSGKNCAMNEFFYKQNYMFTQSGVILKKRDYD